MPIDFKTYLDNLNKTASRQYSAKEVLNIMPHSEFTNIPDIEEEEAVQQDYVTPKSTPNHFDQFLSKHSDRDPEILREGFNAIQERVKNRDGIRYGEPITADHLEELGRKRIEAQAPPLWKEGVKSFARGAIDLPGRLGKALQWYDIDGGSDVIEKAGQAMEQVSNKYQEKFRDDIAPSKQAEISEWYSPRRLFAYGPENMITSVAPMIATLGTTALTGGNVVAGGAAGLATLGTLFYAGSAEEKYRQAKEHGLDDDEAFQLANFEGGIEAGGELVADALHLWLFKGATKAVKNGIIKSITQGEGIKGALKVLGSSMAGELSTEMAQSAAQTAISNQYGVDVGSVGENVLDVIAPTIFMSLVFGGAAATNNYRISRNKKAIVETLNNPNADQEQFNNALSMVVDAAKGFDTTAAKNFEKYAIKQREAGQPIVVQDDNLYKPEKEQIAEWVTTGQKHGEEFTLDHADMFMREKLQTGDFTDDDLQDIKKNTPVLADVVNRIDAERVVESANQMANIWTGIENRVEQEEINQFDEEFNARANPNKKQGIDYTDQVKRTIDYKLRDTNQQKINQEEQNSLTPPSETKDDWKKQQEEIDAGIQAVRGSKQEQRLSQIKKEQQQLGEQFQKDHKDNIRRAEIQLTTLQDKLDSGIEDDAEAVKTQKKVERLQRFITKAQSTVETETTEEMPTIEGLRQKLVGYREREQAIQDKIDNATDDATKEHLNKNLKRVQGKIAAIETETANESSQPETVWHTSINAGILDAGKISFANSEEIEGSSITPEEDEQSVYFSDKGAWTGRFTDMVVLEFDSKKVGALRKGKNYETENEWVSEPKKDIPLSKEAGLKGISFYTTPSFEHYLVGGLGQSEKGWTPEKEEELTVRVMKRDQKKALQKTLDEAQLYANKYQMPIKVIDRLELGGKERIVEPETPTTHDIVDSTLTDSTVRLKFKTLDDARKDFIDKKIQEIGSIEAVQAKYKDDAVVDNYARERATEIFGETTHDIVDSNPEIRENLTNQAGIVDDSKVSDVTPDIPEQRTLPDGSTIKVFKNTETNMETHIKKTAKGYSVSLWDTDANEATPTVSIYPTEEQAIEKAKEVLPTKAEQPPQPQAKEAWQMTREEFVSWSNKETGLNPNTESKSGMGTHLKVWGNGHKTLVENALKKSKSVPDSVLADYPDLQEKYGKPVQPQGTEKATEVQDLEIFQRNINGEDKYLVRDSERGTSSIHDTLEDAQKEVEITKRERARDAKIKEENDKRIQQEKDEAARKKVENEGLSKQEILHKARLNKYLSQTKNYSKSGVMTRKQWLDSRIDAGYIYPIKMDNGKEYYLSNTTENNSQSITGNAYEIKKFDYEYVVSKLDSTTEKTVQGQITPDTTPAVKGTEKGETETTPTTPAVKGKTDKAYLNDNTAIDFQYEVLNHDDLVSSHDDQLRKNPNYPQERQPRERDSQRYMGQITEIANKINPERLGKSANLSDGSPVIDKMSNVVESGNGRTIAIGKAYNEGKAESYKQWLIDNAAEFGLNPDDIQKMDKPVLVRRRMTDMSPEQIKDYTAKANQSAVAKLTPSEQAKIDAELFDKNNGALLSQLRPNENGNLNTATNRAFLNKFVEMIGVSDATGYFTDKHEPNKDLLDRVQSAIIQKAYNSDYLVKQISEEADQDIRNIFNALNVAAADFAKARMVDTNLAGIDILDKIIDAVKFIKQAKAEYEGQVSGGLKAQVNQALSQTDMFGSNIDSVTRDIVDILANNIRNGKRIGIFFNNIAQGLRAYVNEIRDYGQNTLIGEPVIKTTGYLVNKAKEQLKIIEDAKNTKEGDIFNDTGKDAGTNAGKDTTAKTGKGTKAVQTDSKPDKQGHTGKSVEQGKRGADTQRAEAAEKETVNETSKTESVISQASNKFGWRSENTKPNEYTLYNRNNNAVVTVTLLPKDKFKIVRIGDGKKLSDGRGQQQIGSSIEKLLKDYYYAKEVTQPDTKAAEKGEVTKSNLIEKRNQAKKEILQKINNAIQIEDVTPEGYGVEEISKEDAELYDLQEGYKKTIEYARLINTINETKTLLNNKKLSVIERQIKEEYLKRKQDELEELRIQASINAKTIMEAKRNNQNQKTDAKLKGLEFAERELDYDKAYNAYYWSSFVPEKRAKETQENFVRHMNEFQDSILSQITPERYQKALLEIADYKEHYLKKYYEYLSAKAKTMSAAVTGPARFPTQKNNSAMNYERQVADELRDWAEKTQKRVKRELGIGVGDKGTASNPIMRDDPDAVDLLEKKLESLKSDHERMKKANAITRSKSISDEQKINQLIDLGYTKEQAFDLNKTLQETPYHLTNNNANIKRIEDRISELKAQAQDTTSEYPFEGGKIVDNVEAVRVQIVYDGKPDEETRTKLKSKGFRWSPNNKAWQRQRTRQALWDAQNITGVKAKPAPDAKFSKGVKPSTPASLDELPRRQRKIADSLIKQGTLNPLTNAQALNLLQQSGEALYSTSAEVAAFRLANNLPEIKMRKDGSHPTQIATTKSTYRKIYDFIMPDFIKNGKLLDYGAGKNIGGKELGIDTYEPYPEQGFNPTFATTESIASNSYDGIINNAVLNVVPDDIRDAIVKEIGRILKPNGKAYINVRGKDVFDAKHHIIDKSKMEVIIDGNKAYQKGFTQDELVQYLSDTLGEQFTVEAATGKNNFGAVGAIITKKSRPEVLYSKDGLIQGFVLNGKAYIVPENIESGKMWNVIRHEVGTHIGQLLQNDPEFNRLKNRVKLRRDEQSPTGEAIRKAYPRAEAADTNPEFMEEEVLGYLVEDSPDVSIARKLIALIKKYLAKIGINYDLTQADMVALADIAVRREANRRDKNRQQGEAKFAFAGAKAKTANSPMLAKAQEMKAQGKSPEQIWKDTGWWEIVPNQWSFEIDDSQTNIIVEKMIKYGYITEDYNYTLDQAYNSIETDAKVYKGLLSSFMANNQLYRDYPFLKDIEVRYVVGEIESGASFNKNNKIITVYANNIKSLHLKSKLLHEVQHAIQQYEGSAQSLGFKDYDEAVQHAKILNTLRQQYNNAKNAEEKQKIKEHLNNAIDKHNWIWGLENQNFKEYILATGEAESRLVQKRLDMTAAERKAEPPFVTLEKMLREEGLLHGNQKPEDVLISRYDNDGVAQSIGKPLNTDTPAFKAWFKDSKVVDKDGKPLVVHHGSPDVRGIFNNGGFKAGSRGDVWFAAKDYDVANSYTDEKRAYDYQNAEGQVIPLYISMQNPLEIDAKGQNWRDTEKYVKEAKAKGHDGIIIRNSMDYYNNPKSGGKSTTVYAWFNPTQAKSAVQEQLKSRYDGKPISGATGNIGTWDSNNPDIRFSIAPPAAQSNPFSIPDKMNLLDKFKDNYVNQLMSVKKAQDAMGGVSPEADLFTKESLRLAKAADEIKDGIERHINPMLKLMANSKFTIDNVNEYVYSRHAPEANERLKYTTAKEWLLRLAKIRNDGEIEEAIETIEKNYNDAVKKLNKLIKKQSKADVEEEIQELELWLKDNEPKNAFFDELITQFAPDKIDGEKEITLHNKWLEFIEKPSGMTNDEAEKLQDKWKKHPNYKQMQKVAEYFDAMNREKLRISYNAGRMTADEYRAISKTFRFYAPLHREGFEDSTRGYGSGLRNLGKDTMARGGSIKRAVDMLQYAINDYQLTILKAHKAESTTAFKNFVDSLPEGSNFIEYIEAPTKAEYDRSGNIRHVLSHNLQPNEVDFKVDGVLYIARANPKNEYARRIIEQIKFNPEKTGVLVKALSKFNRVLAMVNTSLSPEFLFTNFIKDLEAASINLQATEVSNMTKQVVKDLPIVMNGLHNYMRGNKSHKLTPIIKRYFASGASVGWLDSIGTIEEKTQKLQDELDKLKPLSEVQGNKQKVKIASKKLWDRTGAILMDYNSVVENALRVSAFKSALDAGVSEEQAAMLAKNLTVNFNAKGLHGQVMNSLYLFSNAGIQGSAKVISVLMKSKKARQIIGASVGLSVGLAIANSMIGGDDDDGVSYYEKIDDFQKQRNIIFMLPNGKGKYVSIPLPWGYNVFWKLGEEVGTAIATWDRYKPLDGVSRMITTTLNAFNPLQSGTLLQTVTPTILDPLASWGENKNWSGSPLMPEQNQFSKYPEPDSQRYFPSARKLSVDIAQGLNSLTGGNDVKSGLVDISPETLDLVWDTFTGSAGKFVANTVNVPVKMLAGEELSNREIPFYRRFVGEKSDYVDEQIFRKNVSHIYQLHDQAEKYPERAREFKKDKAYYLLNNLQAVEKRLRRLYKKRKALTAKEDIDRIQETINNTKMKFNTLYNKSF